MTNALTLYRRDNNLTLEAVGLAVGASKGMVSKWENGQAMPRRKYIERLHEFTGGKVSADSFIAVHEAAE